MNLLSLRNDTPQILQCGFCLRLVPSRVKQRLKTPGVDYPILCDCGAVGLQPVDIEGVIKKTGDRVCRE